MRSRIYPINSHHEKTIIDNIRTQYRMNFFPFVAQFPIIVLYKMAINVKMFPQ